MSKRVFTLRPVFVRVAVISFTITAWLIQRLPLTDEGTEPMFDLFHRWFREDVTYRNRDLHLVGQLLYLCLPEAKTRPVACSPIGCDQESLRLPIALMPHPPPPSTDRLDGKLRCVVAGSHTHPAPVAAQVEDPVRNHPPWRRVTVQVSGRIAPISFMARWHYLQSDAR
jgi:hypothetical protein